MVVINVVMVIMSNKLMVILRMCIFMWSFS